MEQDRQANINNDSEEVTLKQVILKIGQLMRMLLRRKWVIIIAIIIGGALGVTAGWLKQANYIGELTFVLEETGGGGGGLGAYAGIASQFGVDLGGMSGRSGVFSGDNVLEFLKSRLMIEKTLLNPMDSTGKALSLAEYYIQFNNLRKDWADHPGIKDIRFPPNADRSKFTLQQDSILHIICATLLKKNLVIEKPDKKLDFIAVKCISKDEQFSKVIVECLVQEVTTFYVETKTKRSKANVDKLQAKADSLEYLLNKKTYSAAATQDLNRNPIRSVASVGVELATRDKLVLQTMYGEVVKNLELSKISLSQETPVIQIVDTPILPLKMSKLGKVKGFIIGSFLMGFLAVFILVLKQLYKDIMA